MEKEKEILYDNGTYLFEGVTKEMIQKKLALIKKDKWKDYQVHYIRIKYFNKQKYLIVDASKKYKDFLT